MQYRIQIVEEHNLTKKYIPQWKMWFLPWQNYTFEDPTDQTEHKITCLSKEMCLDYFISLKEAAKPINEREYPSFHFYCPTTCKKHQKRTSLFAYAVNIITCSIIGIMSRSFAAV